MQCSLSLVIGSLLALVPTWASAQTVPVELRQMLDRLDSAETIEVTVESKVDSMGTWTTKAVTAPKNRLRLEMSIHVQQVGQTQRVEFVTDGTSVVSTTPERTQKSSASPGLKDRFQQSLGRTGFLYSYLTPIGKGSGTNHSLSKLVALSNCTIVKEQAEKARKLTLIAYDFTFDVGEEEKVVSCCLWLDKETHLPVKRTYELQSQQVTETYKNWKINQPINSGTFQT